MAVNAVENRITASKLVRRSLQIADIANTDFLNYEELTEYLNSSFKNVYQTIINYNLNVFTVDANLVGAGGIYKLPWDCYQIKSVKNPYTGREIPRKADSESALGGNYEIVNDTIRLGPSVGPVVITYWRKPFLLTFPNKTIDTNAVFEDVLDYCKNSLLCVNNGAFYIYNCLTDNKLEIESTELIYNDSNDYYLGNNFILEETASSIKAYTLSGKLLFSDNITVDNIIKADDGMLYYVIQDNEDDLYYIYKPHSAEKFYDVGFETKYIVKIDGNFYEVPQGAAPFGIFDNRPTYILGNSLYLMLENGQTIKEEVDIPTIGSTIPLQYGYLTFDGKLYSNIPDTWLDFPNNIYYDVISYDLAIRFLCKQNADSSGVENLNLNAWNQLTSGIDQSADYPRIKLVRR